MDREYFNYTENAEVSVIKNSSSLQLILITEYILHHLYMNKARCQQLCYNNGSTLGKLAFLRSIITYGPNGMVLNAIVYRDRKSYLFGKVPNLNFKTKLGLKNFQRQMMIYTNLNIGFTIIHF